MAKKNLGKVKRYRRSFYTGRQRAARIIGGAAALVALFVAGWLVGPAVINFGTSTWYSIMRGDSDKAPTSTSQSVSQPESGSGESQGQAASEPQPTAQPQPEGDMTQGGWAFLDPASLTSADAAAQLAGEGVRYAVVPLKDSTGSVHYASALPAAAAGLSTTQIDGAAVASALKEQGIVPVAGVCAFQDPLAASANREMAVKYQGTDYLWLDAAQDKGGKAWLNPYADSAVQFIGDLIEELYGCGFEQVCLSAVQFPPAVSSSQGFGETGGLSRDARLAADIAAWDARFADRVTLWYEYPLASCTGVSTTLGALPAQLGVQNLVVSLPAGEAQDPALLEQTAQQMKQLGAAYVVVRDSESGMFY